MSLDERLKQVFADTFETTPNQISETMSVQNSAEWDSMQAMVLAVSSEAEFGVHFTDPELLAMSSYAIIRATLLALPLLA